MGSIEMSQAMLILLAATGTILVLLSGIFTMIRKRRKSAVVITPSFPSAPVNRAEDVQVTGDLPKYSAQAQGGEYVVERNAPIAMLPVGRHSNWVVRQDSSGQVGESLRRPPPAYDPAVPGRV
ncbi:hypothetical protein FRC08_002232 [Ceratobasidium sp. 394]|nr:hypothetical protein FRC08_002232 [Ceratobasidium sp. 394]